MLVERDTGVVFQIKSKLFHFEFKKNLKFGPKRCYTRHARAVRKAAQPRTPVSHSTRLDALRTAPAWV